MMMAAMNSGPRGRLRTATHAAHARVDACFPRGLASTTDYRQYLLGMHAVVHALERALVGLELPSTWQAWRRPERVQWLLDDMVAVGAMPMHDGPGLRAAAEEEADCGAGGGEAWEGPTGHGVTSTANGSECKRG